MARVRALERSVLRHLHEFTILVHDEGYSSGLMSRRPRRASHRNCIGTGLDTLLLAATSSSSSTPVAFLNAPLRGRYLYL
jgi:hypothetical protein